METFFTNKEKNKNIKKRKKKFEKNVYKKQILQKKSVIKCDVDCSIY